MTKLLIYPAIDAQRLSRIQDVSDQLTIVNAQDVTEALDEIKDADAFFGKITPELLAPAEKLQWIQSPTASLEHYVFPELVEHPVQLTNMRGLFYDVIADHVMGFVLCFARNLHRYIRQQADSNWQPIGGKAGKPDFVTGPGQVSEVDRSHMHLSDCSLGVVGAGSIGAEICRRAAAFGMQVYAVDPIATEIPGVVEEVWNVDRLNDLLALSDFTVIAAPHTPQTEKLFRTAQFQQMKSSTYLINIGRGAIVDLNDLTTALQNGDIAGAALDVFEIEPLPREHPLWGMENVIITPHIAAASTRVPERHLETLLENLRCFLTNKPFITLADKQNWF
ncbi:MAG: D-2-hydroxyacid dehydrogenase [Planctomycetes bacterium]|nr:D-2-hydroxyacid dehydrogenase [Planctomycetota bacterium]MCH9727525.1 D-2-hydroxyacid dehydrogenase [Planctomycetota bacterium]MCH9777493.1 D-2-hydroxyacid dehydrogenase [Planctomycetota bacterium]MCH9792132.1 D-2-hydroxyacid dehydrogenase [Planctomycetota bacterium]